MKTWSALGVAAVGLVLGVGAPSADASYLTVNGGCVASIQPNCQSDTLPSPPGFPPETLGGANQLNLDQIITVNGDPYLITGTVFAFISFGPPQQFTLNPEFQVQYVGTGPSHADTLNLFFSQDFLSAATGVSSFTNFLTGFTAGTLGAGSSVQVVNTVGTTSFPPLSSSLLTSSFDVEPPQTESLPTLTNPFTDSLAYTMFIGAGSEPGFIVEVPAPPELAVLGIGLIGLAAMRRRVR